MMCNWKNKKDGVKIVAYDINITTICVEIMLFKAARVYLNISMTFVYIFHLQNHIMYISPFIHVTILLGVTKGIFELLDE